MQVVLLLDGQPLGRTTFAGGVLRTAEPVPWALPGGSGTADVQLTLAFGAALGYGRYKGAPAIAYVGPQANGAPKPKILFLPAGPEPERMLAILQSCFCRDAHTYACHACTPRHAAHELCSLAEVVGWRWDVPKGPLRSFGTAACAPHGPRPCSAVGLVPRRRVVGGPRDSAPRLAHLPAAGLRQGTRIACLCRSPL